MLRLKFSSESKLFGEGPSCLRTTSATLVRVHSFGALAPLLHSNGLTHQLTNYCLVDLIDVTLECEDANSKLVEVVDAGKRVDESLAEVWKLKFSH